MAKQQDGEQLIVGLYPFANIANDYSSYTQMLSGEFNKTYPNSQLQLVIGKDFNPYAPDLDTYLGEDGFDILELDMARKADFKDKVVEVPLEPFRYLAPSVDAVKVDEGKYIGYPTLCCGNFILEVKRKGELAVDMGDKNYEEFKNSSQIADQVMVQSTSSHFKHLLGGKLDDKHGWYLPFIYLNGYIEIYGKHNVQRGINDVLANNPDQLVIDRLKEFFHLFPKEQQSTSKIIDDVIKGEIAYYYGFSEILGKILVAANGSLKAFGAITPTLGSKNLVLVFTDGIVINKARYNKATEEKKEMIQQFVQFYTSESSLMYLYESQNSLISVLIMYS